MNRWSSLPMAAICLTIVACAPPPRASGGPGTSVDPNPAGERVAAPKVMRIAIQREPLGFAPHINGGATTSGGGLQMTEIAQDYLVLTDDRSAYQPGLALELPSLENG